MPSVTLSHIQTDTNRKPLCSDLQEQQQGRRQTSRHDSIFTSIITWYTVRCHMGQPVRFYLLFFIKESNMSTSKGKLQQLHSIWRLFVLATLFNWAWNTFQVCCILNDTPLSRWIQPWKPEIIVNEAINALNEPLHNITDFVFESHPPRETHLETWNINTHMYFLLSHKGSPPLIQHHLLLLLSSSAHSVPLRLSTRT